VHKKVKFFLSMPWRHIGGTDVLLHSFLTLPLDGGTWLTSHRKWFTPTKEAG
jgi:hypothetical protein